MLWSVEHLVINETWLISRWTEVNIKKSILIYLIFFILRRAAKFWEYSKSGIFHINEQEFNGIPTKKWNKWGNNTAEDWISVKSYFSPGLVLF